MSKKYITPKSWNEFRDTGLFWFTNMILNAFGWTLCLEKDEDIGLDEYTVCYPARTRFRGFTEKTNTGGYIKLSEYIDSVSKELIEEAYDRDEEEDKV